MQIGSPRPAGAAAPRSCDSDPAQPSSRLVFKRSDGGSHARSRCTHSNLLAELAAINATIEANGMPFPPRVNKRARKLKLLWEE